MGHSEVVRVMLLRGAERDAARDVSATSACALSAVLCFLVCFEAARLPEGWPSVPRVCSVCQVVKLGLCFCPRVWGGSLEGPRGIRGWIERMKTFI